MLPSCFPGLLCFTLPDLPCSANVLLCLCNFFSLYALPTPLLLLLWPALEEENGISQASASQED